MRLERALYEYFVAGIKTNISLFRRILRDPDFQAGRLDTGYLDRLLAKNNQSVLSSAPGPKPEAGDETKIDETTIAAIAAGMFAVLDPAAPAGKNGNSSGSGSGGPGSGPAASAVSNWKHQGRSEALR
jgi:acetyl-CoA carboxylase biotin carboxylase subunit